MAYSNDIQIGPSMSDIIIVLVMLGLPILLTALNLFNLFSPKQIKPHLIDGLTMILGSTLTVILFGVINAKDYDQALGVPLGLKWHTPIASWHLPTIFILSIMGLIGYGILRKSLLDLPPLLIVICISCMMIGGIIGGIWILQLTPHLFANNSDILFDNFYLCIFPFNYLICCAALAKKVLIEYTMKENTYTNPILRKCDLLLRNSNTWPLISIVLMIPILGCTILVLMLFGQQPSAVIKAFTETSDWLLSQKISPPPVEVNGHYLCTVSLRGHRRFVKPLRYGIRHNERIVVNRQLCVANAFEQLIQERMFKTHRLIRNIYDQYGYPLSKIITSPIKADLVFFL